MKFIISPISSSLERIIFFVYHVLAAMVGLWTHQKIKPGLKNDCVSSHVRPVSSVG